jgi:hypothetical protein
MHGNSKSLATVSGRNAVLDGGGDGGLGSLPPSRQPIHISESTLRGRRSPGQFPTLPMGFEADHADTHMTPFARRCLATRANEFQRGVLLSQFSLFSYFHYK